MTMLIRNSNDARTQWAEMIEQVRDEPVHIQRRGRAVAVLVSPEFFDRAVEALEDIADIEAVDAALAEDAPLVSHDDLMSELGIETT